MRVGVSSRGSVFASLGCFGTLFLGPFLLIGYVIFYTGLALVLALIWLTTVAVRACRRQPVFRHRGRGRGVMRML